MRYSDNEDTIIRECISELPTNLGLAFENAAKRIAQELMVSRTALNIRQRWYIKLRSGEPITALATTVGAISNVKNQFRPKDEPLYIQVLRLIVPRLNKEERMALVASLIGS